MQFLVEKVTLLNHVNHIKFKYQIEMLFTDDNYLGNCKMNFLDELLFGLEYNVREYLHVGTPVDAYTCECES